MAGFISTVERHQNRNAIIARILAGDSLKSIGADFALSVGALSRFKQKIIRPAVLGVQNQTNQHVVNTVREMRDLTKHNAGSLIVGTSTADLVARKLERYDRILGMAERDRDVSGWASVDRAETATLQLQAQLRGEINQVHTQTTVQMMVYTPQVQDESQAGEDEDRGEVQVLDVVAEPVEIPAAPMAKPAKPKKPPKPPKPPSRIKQLQKLSAAERKQAIRLIGQGLDPFASAPDLPD